MTDMLAIVERRRVAEEEADLHRALRRFVGSRLRDPVDGEDIVQETYLRLYAYRRTRTVADVGAFCFAVARNLVQDHLRRLKRMPLMGELDAETPCPTPRADEILFHRQRVQVLTQALGVMPPLRREVFLRRRLDEQPAVQVAEDLDLSVAAVEKHVTRALADLRAALARRGLSFSGDA